MIEFKINDLSVEIASQLIFSRNRKEQADNGSVTILNTRAERYEPFTRVEFTSAGITNQFLIESDEPLQLKGDLYEHELTLIENMAIFTTVFPVDRQFTRVPALTIREILDIYIREASFYYNFEFSYEDNALFNKTMVDKEYTESDLAAIIYDLFKIIDAIPRVTWSSAEGWVLSCEPYNERNDLVTINAENKQSTVNDVDYATDLLTKTRNATNEGNNGIWFPSVNGYVEPRTKGTKFTTSDLQYEVDSNISVIYEALALDIPITVENWYSDNYRLFTTRTVNVDIKDFILTDDEYKTLINNYDYSLSDYVDFDYENADRRNFLKQHCVTYKIGDNIIENLFSQETVGVFEGNIEHLRNAIAYGIGREIKEYLREELRIVAEEEDIVLSDSWNYTAFAIPTTENVKLRLRYRPSRDITYISEKSQKNNLRRSAILNKQGDRSVELSRMLDASSAIINRIGNNVMNVTQSFADLASAWKLGDYNTDNLMISDVLYTLDKNLCIVTADFTENFSNINRETSISREPSSYVYTGNNLVSNYVIREYVLFSKSDALIDNSIINSYYRRVFLNMLDFDLLYSIPINTILFRHPSLDQDKAIHMPVMSSAGGNTMIMHGQFNDARTAGNGMRFIGNSWYLDPVVYTDDDFIVEDAYVKLGNQVNYLTDTETKKYYPLVQDYGNVQPNIEYYIPVDKDPNDIFSLTFEIIAASEDDDVIIGRGFAKNNNIINPLKKVEAIYSSTEPFNIFSKAKGVQVDGHITLDEDLKYFEVVDADYTPIEYWALTDENDDVIIAGNNFTERVYVTFTSRRTYNDLELYLVDAVFANSMNFEPFVRHIEIFNKDVDFENTFDVEFTTKYIEVFMKNTYFDNDFDFDTIVKKIDVENINTYLDNEFEMQVDVRKLSVNDVNVTFENTFNLTAITENIDIENINFYINNEFDLQVDVRHLIITTNKNIYLDNTFSLITNSSAGERNINLTVSSTNASLEPYDYAYSDFDYPNNTDIANIESELGVTLRLGDVVRVADVNTLEYHWYEIVFKAI